MSALKADAAPQGGRGQEFEAEHVHDVYESIASHFSSTRYKPWPVVASFLESLPPGSVGIDAGCGNGKYLPVNKSVFIVASDRSPSLVQIAKQHQPHDSVVADLLSLPHPLHTKFDFALSIAAVHHLSTRDRRVQALKALLETVTRDNGRVLVFVWALEQENSRRGWNEADEQDVMVPWVRAQKKTGGDANNMNPQDQTFFRYYHLYKKGELEEDVVRAGGLVLSSGYEKDNWWAIASPSVMR